MRKVQVKFPAIFEPVRATYMARGGSTVMLDRIGSAMLVWAGPGGKVAVQHGGLRAHFDSTRKNAQHRWKSPQALLRVASLLKRSRVELRKLILDETPLECCASCTHASVSCGFIGGD